MKLGWVAVGCLALVGCGSAGDGGGGGDGGSCAPEDVTCFCDACEADGGTCMNTCQGSLGPFGGECVMPDPLEEGEIACGAVNCGQGTICVDRRPMMDGCPSQACESPPSACQGEALGCDCVASYIAESTSATCTEVDGHVVIDVTTTSLEPSWWSGANCGGAPCEGDETCWGCLADGTTAAVYGCQAEDPSGPTTTCQLRDAE